MALTTRCTWLTTLSDTAVAAPSSDRHSCPQAPMVTFDKGTAALFEFSYVGDVRQLPMQSLEVLTVCQESAIDDLCLAHKNSPNQVPLE